MRNEKINSHTIIEDYEFEERDRKRKSEVY